VVYRFSCNAQWETEQDVDYADADYADADYASTDEARRRCPNS